MFTFIAVLDSFVKFTLNLLILYLIYIEFSFFGGIRFQVKYGLINLMEQYCLAGHLLGDFKTTFGFQRVKILSKYFVMIWAKIHKSLYVT